jgi:hypothetical protein
LPTNAARIEAQGAVQGAVAVKVNADATANVAEADHRKDAADAAMIAEMMITADPKVAGPRAVGIGAVPRMRRSIADQAKWARIVDRVDRSDRRRMPHSAWADRKVAAPWMLACEALNASSTNCWPNRETTKKKPLRVDQGNLANEASRAEHVIVDQTEIADPKEIVDQKDAGLIGVRKVVGQADPVAQVVPVVAVAAVQVEVDRAALAVAASGVVDPEDPVAQAAPANSAAAGLALEGLQADRSVVAVVRRKVVHAAVPSVAAKTFPAAVKATVAAKIAVHAAGAKDATPEKPSRRQKNSDALISPARRCEIIFEPVFLW